MVKPCSLMTEAELQEAVADYIRRQYPNVMFHSDFGSGIKLTPGQAVKQKRQNGGRRAWPDMFIATPVTITSAHMEGIYEKYFDGSIEVAGLDHVYHTLCGLFLELKKDGARLEMITVTTKNSNRRALDGRVYASLHLKEQADVLYQLRERGYAAEFAVGFEEAKKIIDEYLGGK